MGIDPAQAVEVVVDRLLHRGRGILADVDTQRALETHAGNPLHQRIHTQVVETHAVDDGVGLRQAKQPGLRVAGLGPGRDGAHLDETEAQARQAVDRHCILVQTRRQPDRIVEGHAQHLHRMRRHRPRQPGGQPQPPGSTKQIECQIMGSLRRQAEHQGTQVGIHRNAPVENAGRSITYSAQGTEGHDATEPWGLLRSPIAPRTGLPQVGANPQLLQEPRPRSEPRAFVGAPTSGRWRWAGTKAPARRYPSNLSSDTSLPSPVKVSTKLPYTPSCFRKGRRWWAGRLMLRPSLACRRTRPAWPRYQAR